MRISLKDYLGPNFNYQGIMIIININIGVDMNFGIKY